MYIRKAISKVPVDYGMARGTFLNIAEKLNETVPINPKRTKYGVWYRQKGKGPVVRSPNAGRLFAHPYFPNTESIVKIEGDNITFEFSNDLLYYYLNEFGLVHGPWNSFEEGKVELLKYFNENLANDLPQIFPDFVTVTEVKG